MGFLTQTLLAPFRERALPLQGPLPLTADRVAMWLDGGMGTTAAGVTITPQTALTISAVYACVRVKSEDVAKLPLILYEQQGRSREQATTHPLFQILHRTPNPFMTSMQMRETMQAHVELWGNAYASIERDAAGRVVGFWPLQPNRMERPILAADGRLLYTYHLPTGEPRALTQDDVFHLRGLSSDGIMGYSPVALHRETFGWTQAIKQYNSAFYGNSANPSGVLQTDNKLSKEAADRLRQAWNAAHQGVTNAHRVAVLEDGVKWQQLGIQPVDAQYIETMQFMVDDVARIFRVPPHKIQSLLHATFSNIEEENLAYVTDTLQSMCERWEQQIFKDLLLPAEQQIYYPKHNLNALLRGKTLERYQAYQLGIQQGILSPNDVLELEDRNPFDGGDVHLQQANMVPFGTLPAPTPAPAPAPRMLRTLRRTADGYELREAQEADAE